MKPLRLLTVLLTLAGCQSSARQSLAILPPADLTSPCDPLRDFTGTDSRALLSYSVGMAFQYHECAAKQASLAQWSKEINQ